MKILVDATLAFEDNWYELIPIVISNKTENWYDVNNHDFSYENNFNSYKTSFLNPSLTEKLVDNKTIIFTVPRSLSNQYDVYKKSIENENVLVLEGIAFFNQKNKVKEIIEKYKDFETIANEINKLNNETKYYGLILDFKDVPKNGRMNLLIKTFLKISKLKALLEFNEGKWKLLKISNNGWKLIENITNDLAEINLATHDHKHESIKKYVSKIKETNNHKKVTLHHLTNSMTIHSGKSFLAIF